MKLDKIKFAKLISWFGHRMKSAMTISEIEWLDNHIDIELPKASVISAEALHTLMGLMQEGTKKIEAIKQYRTLTGQGLRESMDAVEKYWCHHGYTKAKLYDIEHEMTISDEDSKVIKHFIGYLT